MVPIMLTAQPALSGLICHLRLKVNPYDNEVRRTEACALRDYTDVQFVSGWRMKGRLLIVDDERGIVVALKGLFTKEGYEVETADCGEQALEKFSTAFFDVMITDLSMKGMDGLQLLKQVREIAPNCAVLMITAYGTQRIAVEAMKAGAEDYLPKPFDNDELRMKVRKVMETQLLKRAHSQLLEQVRLETGVFEKMIGKSRAMMRVFETIDK